MQRLYCISVPFYIIYVHYLSTVFCLFRREIRGCFFIKLDEMKRKMLSFLNKKIEFFF